MKSKKIIKTLAVMMLSVMVLNGVETVNPISDFTSPKVAYAETNTGLSTPTGIVSGIIKYQDKILKDTELSSLISLSTQINPTNNQDFFTKHPTTGNTIFAENKINLSEKPYYWANHENEFNMKIDKFIQVYSMELGSKKDTIIKHYSMMEYIDGICMDKFTYSKEFTDTNAYNYLLNESKTEEKPSEPSEPTEPTKKIYSSVRLGGATRFETATAIAKEANSNKLDSVILTNAYNFPDALTGSTLSAQKNAPILLIGNDKHDTVTLNYLKSNLKSTGTVYVLGGTSCVSTNTLNKVKNLGFKNIKRLGGSDRYATNMSIVDELNVSRGSSVIIANSMSYADSLSVSGISGANNMPIILVNGSLTSSALEKIKSIAPKNIYIVGSTTVVNSNIEKQLKSYGNVVRLGGKDRYETSLKIANYFTKDSQTTALISYGLKFPDALSGSYLASKTASPILLMNNNVSSQKNFIDSTKINKLYILGSNDVISDSIVNQLKK